MRRKLRKSRTCLQILLKSFDESEIIQYGIHSNKIFKQMLDVFVWFEEYVTYEAFSILTWQMWRNHTIVR